MLPGASIVALSFSPPKKIIFWVERKAYQVQKSQKKKQVHSYHASVCPINVLYTTLRQHPSGVTLKLANGYEGAGGEEDSALRQSQRMRSKPSQNVWVLFYRRVTLGIDLCIYYLGSQLTPHNER